ncbi:MAG: 30S ribosomal protein S20 [candidate division KSB1 bacterium]|nr:30S ribosomal protein S20 [candidate division KSB1 bacterium]
MAHTDSARKRIRQAEKRRLRNRHFRTMMKTLIRKVRTAPDATTAVSAYREASSLIDKLVAKGIIHRNTAANKKSRLARFVNRTFQTSVC